MRAHWLLLAAALLAGCSEESPPPTAPDTPPLGTAPTSPRVLVVNTLSETISALDLETGTMQVQAAVAGTWTNRATSSPRLLFVTNSGDNEVRVLDAASLATLASIDVGDGRNPFLARALPDGQVLVTNWLTAEVQWIDLAARRVDATVTTTRGPEGFAIDGERAFIACTNYEGAAGEYGEGRLDVIHLAQRRVETSIPVGRNPQDVLVAPDGRIHVVCTGNYGSKDAEGRIDVLDAAATSVTASVELGGSPARAAIAPDGTVWVVGYQGALRRYDPVSLIALDDPVDPALPASGLSAIAFDDVAGRAYVTSFPDDLLIAIDVASRMAVDVWIVGDGPVDVLVQRP